MLSNKVLINQAIEVEDKNTTQSITQSSGIQSSFNSSYGSSPSSVSYFEKRHRGLSIAENDAGNLIQLEMIASHGFSLDDYSDLPSLVLKANIGMKRGVKPVLADGAMGGTYFLRDEKNNFVLVCKPGDEEPNSPHNPHQTKHGETVWRGWYRGRIVPGFGMYREVSAFLLDGGFAGVPPTKLARVREYFLRTQAEPLNEKIYEPSHSSTASVYKICSVQSYARHECSAEDMGPGKFVKDDVHRIAALDIRLCNLDRHEGNMLVCRSNPYHRVAVDPNKSGSFIWDVTVDESSQASKTDNDRDSMLHLVPIDHGYVLPHVLCMNDPSLSWMNWPQVKEPMSASLLRHIETLDYAKDVELLRRVVGAAISETSLLTLQVCTSFLKKGSVAGLTLYEMGSAMCPYYSCRDVSPISQLQKAVHLAIQNTIDIDGSCCKSTYKSMLLKRMFSVETPSSNQLPTQQQQQFPAAPCFGCGPASLLGGRMAGKPISRSESHTVFSSPSSCMATHVNYKQSMQFKADNGNGFQLNPNFTLALTLSSNSIEQTSIESVSPINGVSLFKKVVSDDFAATSSSFPVPAAAAAEFVAVDTATSSSLMVDERSVDDTTDVSIPDDSRQEQQQMMTFLNAEYSNSGDGWDSFDRPALSRSITGVKLNSSAAPSKSSTTTLFGGSSDKSMSARSNTSRTPGQQTVTEEMLKQAMCIDSGKRLTLEIERAVEALVEELLVASSASYL